MSFELTFLGASGGPIEQNTCGVMIKPANVSYNHILLHDSNPLLAVDAGSGYYTLAELIRDRHSVANRAVLLYTDSLPIEHYLHPAVTFPFADLGEPDWQPLATLKKLMRRLKSVLVTHPHLDHILALVINLAGLLVATPREPGLTVYGSDFTVEALHKHVFNDVIWPDLVLAKLFELTQVDFHLPFLVNDGYYTITMMELSHGHLCGGVYASLVYLVCNNHTQDKLLMFGDFESDVVLATTKNRRVWETIAPHIDDGSLKGMVLECSSPTKAPGTELYGHLTPPHLIGEMEMLQSLCETKLGKKPLEGLNVIITHVKEDERGDPRRRVLHELRELNEKAGLGLHISVAISGVLIVL